MYIKCINNTLNILLRKNYRENLNHIPLSFICPYFQDGELSICIYNYCKSSKTKTETSSQLMVSCYAYHLKLYQDILDFIKIFLILYTKKQSGQTSCYCHILLLFFLNEQSIENDLLKELFWLIFLSYIKYYSQSYLNKMLWTIRTKLPHSYLHTFKEYAYLFFW